MNITAPASAFLMALMSAGCTTAPAPQQLAANASLAQDLPKSSENERSENLLRLGSDIEARGSLATALPLYERAAASPDATADIHARLGDAYVKLDRLEEAEAAYRKALEKSPDHGTALLGLGGVLIRLGNAEDGLATLSKAASILNTAAAYDRLGIAHVAMAQPGEAVASFEQAHSMDPDDIDISTNLALAAALTGRYDKALALATMLTKSPLLKEYHRRNLVLIVAISGKPEEAKQMFADSIEPAVAEGLIEQAKAVHKIKSPKERALALGMVSLRTETGN